jgi:hypothetical protein
MTVTSLTDREDILNQLGAAARLLDQKEWHELDQVFHPEVTFDYGDGLGTRSGLDALRDHFRRFLDGCGPTQHLLGSIIWTRAETGATTHAYVQARHDGLGDLSGEVFDTNGEYVDQWARTEGGGESSAGTSRGTSSLATPQCSASEQRRLLRSYMTKTSCTSAARRVGE